MGIGHIPMKVIHRQIIVISHVSHSHVIMQEIIGKYVFKYL